MRKLVNNVKRVNAILWTGNVLLIIGIVAFAFQFLIFQDILVHEVDPPISIPPTTSKNPNVTDIRALRDLANPLKPPVGRGPVPPRGPIGLTGTDSIANDPTSHTAYLNIKSRNLAVNAYAGEAIRDEAAGVEVPELAGWRLKNVTSTTAVFKTADGEVTLQLEEITAAPPGLVGTAVPGGIPAPQPGAAWEKAKYATKKNDAQSDDNREVWQVDRKEVEWAGTNWETVLQGVSLEAYPAGGLKINSLPDGGYATDRGFRAGDVLKVVNGQAIDSIVRLQEIMKSMAKTQTTLNVIVDRSGRLYTLQYQVQPAGRQPR
ncbi:MAG TPA: S1C family serine protease [Planctomycetota bacterium]|nr:S1C family serine protease [Planctomycetota bacterium]